MARILLGMAAAVVALSACGEAGGAANTTNPTSTVSGYMQAVASDPGGGQPFLETNINDGIPLTGPTTASRFLADNKGAHWQLVAVPWVDPVSKAPVTTKKACTVLPPQGGQLCLVVVEVTAGDKKVWFHFDTEDRYTPGKWLILNVTRVDTKPDDLLPNGNEAHSG